jgi:hypothetical protein
MATNPPATDARVISATTDRLFETVEGLFGRPLTAPERLTFTTRLAGINTTAVAPGDLITADLFNALRADINDLALRLAIVEDGVRNTASPPIITRIEPPGMRTGEEMTVFGRNLLPAMLTSITVGGVDVPLGRIISGADTVLIFPSPAIPGLPAAGAQVPVRITNGAGEAVQPFFIRGATTDVLVAGFAFGSPGLRLPGGGALPGQVAANTDYELVYTVKASSSRAETFTVSTVITPASGGWSASIVPGDETMAVPQTVAMVDRTVRVRVRTGASGTATVRLMVRGTTDANAGGESDSTSVTVATAPPVAVTAIVFGSLVKAAGGAPISVTGSTVYFGEASGANTDRVVRCEVTVNAPAGANAATLYQIGDPVISGGAGWEARLDMAPGDRSLSAPAGGAAQGMIRVALRFTGAFNAASPTAFDRTLSVPVTGPGGTPARNLTFNLRRRTDHATPTPP